MKSFMEVEDLDVYQRLCMLHIEVCDLSYEWPVSEKYELGSQVRRSSNSAPAQLAEKMMTVMCETRSKGLIAVAAKPEKRSIIYTSLN